MPISKIGTNSIDQSTPQQIGGVSVGQGAGAVSSNTAVGNGALVANTTGANSVAIGTDALRSQNTGGSNSAVGQGSMYTTTTGYYNVAMGNSAMYYNTTGYQNVAVGVSALQSNTTAANNTAVGYQALYSHATGDNNLALGHQAGYSNASTAYNVFCGYQAGYYTTGGSNTFVGSQAGISVTSGTKNTIIGQYGGNQGGLDIRTASNYIVLSDGDGNPAAYSASSVWSFFGLGTPSGYYNSATVNIGRNTTGQWVLATTGYDRGCLIRISQNAGYAAYFETNSATSLVTAGSISISGTSTTYATSSDYRLKENIQPMTGALAKVQALKPVTYNWKNDGIASQGFIAHELQAVVPECVVGEKDGVDADGKPVYQGIDTSFLVATLTAAIQELKADLDATKAELAALKGQP